MPGRLGESLRERRGGDAAGRLPRAVPTAVLLTAALLVALLAYGVVRQGEDLTLDAAVADGSRPTAPGADIKLPALDGGRARSLGEWRGRWVVLNVWASWCDPCRAEAPVLQDLQRRLRASGSGTVLGVTYDDNRRDSQAFARQYGLTFPIVRDVGKRLSTRLGTRAIPETFVIDPQGRVASISRGAVDSAFAQRTLRLAGAI